LSREHFSGNARGQGDRFAVDGGNRNGSCNRRLRIRSVFQNCFFGVFDLVFQASACHEQDHATYPILVYLLDVYRMNILITGAT